MNDNDLLNLPKLLERLEGDKELLAEIFDVFTDEVSGRVERLDAALASSDLQAMLQWAHSLKGTSGTLQAEPLRDCCLKMEAAARAGDHALAVSLAPQAVELLRLTAAHIDSLKGTF